MGTTPESEGTVRRKRKRLRSGSAASERPGNFALGCATLPEAFTGWRRRERAGPGARRRPLLLPPPLRPETIVEEPEPLGRAAAAGGAGRGTMNEEEQFVNIDLNDDNICSVCKLGTDKETLSFCHICFELNIEDSFRLQGHFMRQYDCWNSSYCYFFPERKERTSNKRSMPAASPAPIKDLFLKSHLTISCSFHLPHIQDTLPQIK
uniref:Chromosome 21 open reading frame 91 n=1 Tax=Oryctolagus cuniculus TaxID=9986 RepID=A0A5F9DS45_RABIT